jgi:carbon storage regulator CsrA
MLILTRKEDQSVVFPNCGIVVHVLSVKGRTIKLGFEAPKDIEVLRGELVVDKSPPPPARSSSYGAEKVPFTSVSEQIHDLKNRLNTVTLSIQLYNDLKSLGQDKAASSTLDRLVAKLAEIDFNWNVEDVSKAFNTPRSGGGELSQASDSLAGLRLLVVDDDANERELLAGVMTLKGCHCVTAASGNEALDVIENGGEFDFALMDMHMPDLDGPSTLRAIRSDPRTKKLKVFSVSGTSPSEVGAMIGGDGFDGWLPKPLNPAILLNHMQESLRRERATG